MKLLSFRIKNFRSIKDIGECRVEDLVTIIAGKNESGKSNILLALQKFSSEKFSKADQNLNETADIEVITKWQIVSEDLHHFDFLNNKFLLPGNPLELIVTKTYSNETVITLLSGAFITWINANLEIEREHFSKEVSKLIPDKYKMIDDKNTELIFDFKKVIQDLSNIDLSTKTEKQATNIKLKVDELINRITVYSTYYDLPKLLDNKVLQIVPKFVLFDSFSDILPDTYSIGEGLTPILSSFFSLLKIDPSKLLNDTDSQLRRLSTNRISQDISGNFSSFYSQNKVIIEVQIDGPTLCFFIYDKDSNKNTPFKPKQRSKGFQWFLSFYITLNSEESDSRVILIDEPGLYLHAKAQLDILGVINNLAKRNQVIFSTHSPYLIDANNLGQIRLIIKEENQNTIIQNKFYKGADKDTLTPIITAIGHDLANSLTFSPKLNVLVEGISDYYYILGMNSLVPKHLHQDIKIIPSIGASQINNLVSILIGWGLIFICVFDNDKEGRRVANDLRKRFLLDDKQILFVSDKEDERIEDLFSYDDFCSLILEEPVEEIPIKNSELSKKISMDKIKSKIFANKAVENSVSVDEVTQQNFQSLIEKINSLIK